jgi:hypothetical protein
MLNSKQWVTGWHAWRTVGFSKKRKHSEGSQSLGRDCMPLILICKVLQPLIKLQEKQFSFIFYTEWQTCSYIYNNSEFGNLQHNSNGGKQSYFHFLYLSQSIHYWTLFESWKNLSLFRNNPEVAIVGEIIQNSPNDFENFNCWRGY